MSLAIGFPFYWCADPERREVTRKVLHHYQLVCDELGVVLVGLGSEGDVSRDVWCEHHPAWAYFEYDQTFWPDTADASGSSGLAHKFNCTLDACRTFEPSHIAMVGSDDVLSASFFVAAVCAGYDMVGPGNGAGGGAYLWDLPTGRQLWWDGHFTQERWRDLPICNGAFVWSVDALDRCGWQPWFFGPHEGHVVVGCEQRGLSVGAVNMVSSGFRYWMVKARTVLNSVALMEQSGMRLVAADGIEAEQFTQYWAAL